MSIKDINILDTFKYSIKSGDDVVVYSLALMSINGSSSPSLLVNKDGNKATLKDILELFSLLHSSKIVLHGDSNSLSVNLYSLAESGKLVDYSVDNNKGIYVATIDSGLTRVLGVIFNKDSDHELNLTFYEDLHF